MEQSKPPREVGDRAAEMFDFVEIASARTAEVDRLQGVLNQITDALALVVGHDAKRVPTEGLPEMVKAALLRWRGAAIEVHAQGIGCPECPEDYDPEKDPPRCPSLVAALRG